MEKNLCTTTFNNGTEMGINCRPTFHTNTMFSLFGDKDFTENRAGHFIYELSLQYCFTILIATVEAKLNRFFIMIAFCNPQNLQLCIKIAYTKFLLRISTNFKGRGTSPFETPPSVLVGKDTLLTPPVVHIGHSTTFLSPFRHLS